MKPNAEYNETVRRLLASLLLNVLAFALIAPAISVRTDSQLPACCRANGKHKCAMLAKRYSSGVSETGKALVSEQCPYSHSSGTLGTAFQLPGFTVTTRFSRAATIAGIVRPEIVRQVRWTNSRSHCKRGPPLSLA